MCDTGQDYDYDNFKEDNRSSIKLRLSGKRPNKLNRTTHSLYSVYEFFM